MVAAEKVLVAAKGEEKILVGPCCVQDPALNPVPKFNYHIELSSERGLVAVAEYGGFQISFHKSAHEVQQTASKFIPSEEPYVAH